MCEQTPLTDIEIDAIVKLLRSGQYVGEQYQQRLFRSVREGVLSYSGKESRGSILSTTMAVPLQVVKRFGPPTESWSNKLIFGDNLQVLKRLVELKRQGQLLNADGSQGIRLCYIDPPFATKREYRGKKGQLAYRDRVAGAEFIEFLRKRIVFIHELLADDGSLYLHLDTNKTHYMKLILDEIFGAQNFRTEIIWKRSTAHSDTKQGRVQHGRIHDTILFYTKGEQRVWNSVYTPYDEAYVEQRFVHQEPDGRRYKDADMTAAKPGGDTLFDWHVKAPAGTNEWQGDPEREGKKRPRPGWIYKSVLPSEGRYWAYSIDNFLSFHHDDLIYYTSTGTPRLKQYADELEGVAIQDLWTDIFPVNSQALERLGYPTQKPLALLERIIRSSSKPGDLVLDCFAGSGTTAEAAELHDRRWIAVDCGKLAIYTTQRRLLTLEEGRGRQRKRRDPRPFDQCNAGLYDNSLLERLNFEQFTGFALELFDCRPHAHQIGGIPMSGTRRGGPVHMFPFQETQALLGEEYIDSLHARIGNHVTGPVYVVAPAAHCDLFRDVFEIDRCMYFVMQIPYSVIEALHERKFQPFGQPAALAEINDAIDSYGFDFVQLPEAKTTYVVDGEELVATLAEFRRGGLDPDDFEELPANGRNDLAMVLVDPDYDGDAFRARHFEFADELASMNWSFRCEVEASKLALAIYIDVRGNELRELIKLDSLRQVSK